MQSWQEEVLNRAVTTDETWVYCYDVYHFPLQNFFSCSRFAANLQQICCRLICRKEEFMFAGVCRKLQSYCEHHSFLRHTCCERMSAGRLQKTMLDSPTMFAGALQETLNHSEMFTGNLRELSTIKIVCRKPAEILNIF